MNMTTRPAPSFVRRSISLLLLVGLAVGLLGMPSATQAAPAAARLAAATLPPTISCTPSCELWATTGTLALPGGVTVPIWGYATSAGGSAQLPGPVILADEGDSLSITLHNALAIDTSLSFPALPLVPDLAGVAPGDTKVYSFTADDPGTFLYEASLVTAEGPRQVAMGLVGALIVRPAGQPTWAYDANTQFDDETLLIYTEMDPALNANPLTFNMQNYAPKYFMINGKAYPDTVPIATAPGARSVLLRHLNAGLDQHSIGLLGLDKGSSPWMPGSFPYAPSCGGQKRSRRPGARRARHYAARRDPARRYAVYDGLALAQRWDAARAGWAGRLWWDDDLPDHHRFTLGDGPLAGNPQVSPN